MAKPRPLTLKTFEVYKSITHPIFSLFYTHETFEIIGHVEAVDTSKALEAAYEKFPMITRGRLAIINVNAPASKASQDALIAAGMGSYIPFSKSEELKEFSDEQTDYA